MAKWSASFGATLVLIGLCGSAAAFDDSALPRGRGDACSFLCGSWMKLGQAAKPDPATPETVAAPPRLVLPSAKPAVPGAVAQGAVAPSAVASSAVESGLRAKTRAAHASAIVKGAAKARSRHAASDVTASRTEMPQLRAVAAIPPADVLAPSPPPVVPHSTADAPIAAIPTAVRGPVPDSMDLPATVPSPPPDQAPVAVTQRIEDSSPPPRPTVPVPSAEPASSLLAAPAAPVPVLERQRSDGTSTGSSLGVKLGFYAVLALIGFVALRRTRRDSPGGPASEPVPPMPTAPQAVARRSDFESFVVQAKQLGRKTAPA